MDSVEHVLAIHNVIGEGPVWSQSEGALYWVDFIENNHIWRYFPTTDKSEVFETGEPVTAVGFRSQGGLIAATMKGIAFWDADNLKLDYVTTPTQDRSHIRFNDASVDRQGRLWVGTVNDQDPKAADGELFRFDPDGSVRVMDSGFTVSNGIGWSPDNSVMYFVDTFRYQIYAYDFDAQSGGIANRRTFADFSAGEELPDGLTVDSEGGVWVAFWGGWKVIRFDPSGAKDREIKMPVQNPTSCAFGGEHLDELYITSAHLGLSAEEKQKQPMAGDLFRVRVGIRGIAEPVFGG
jgi:sugar lactone lactonase YvrE